MKHIISGVFDSLRKIEVITVKKATAYTLFLILMVVCFTGCQDKDNTVRESAQFAADAFSSGDMASIHQVVFGTSQLELDGDLSALWGQDIQSQGGVLDIIFESVTVEVKKITDTAIEYEIIAPDMSNVFAELSDCSDTISENELLEFIYNYAHDTEMKESIVTVAYVFADDGLLIDYKNKDFINAVTGNLLDAYISTYGEMMESYMEGGE